MGDNTEMGTLAVNEELHAKQQEAARKEAERAARKAPQDAAADAKGEAGKPASKKGSAARSSRPPGRSAIGGRACRAQAGRPVTELDGTPVRDGADLRPQAGAAADRRSRRIRRVAPGRRGDGARRDGGTRAGRALQMMPHQESASETAPRSIYDPGGQHHWAEDASSSCGG